MSKVLASLRSKSLAAWAFIRQASGDDAYERYLAHQHDCHPGQPVLNRKDFFRHRLSQKWQGIKRCC